MSFQLILLILTILLSIVFGIIFVKYSQTPYFKRRPDYLSFFILGLFWTFVGIITTITYFSFVGIIMSLFGIINHKRWKNRPTLTHAERRMRYTAAAGLTIIVIIGYFLILLRPEI